MKYLWFLILSSTTTSVICSNISFNNVAGFFTILKNLHRQPFYITSGSTLKDYLPSEPLSTLNIHTSDIPILYEDSVTDLTIETIYFNDVNLKEIKPGAFRNLTTSRLSLVRNKIETLQEGTFENLPLKYITLYGNSISTIHPGAFKNLTELEVLELHHNKLQKIGMFNLPSLERLALSFNTITDIEKEIFSKNPKLKYVNLAHNSLAVVKRGVFDSPSLSELVLYENTIREVEFGAFVKLPNLGKLNLGQNRLQDIKEGTFNNLNLQVISLVGNNISFIASTAFDNMTKLEEIRLDMNNLSTYNPNWFKNDVNLIKLHLDNNHIEEIPDDAFRNIGNNNNKSLVISIKNNGVKKISETAFKSLRKIMKLNLESNRIETWTDAYLKDTEYIEYLDLTHNRLKCVNGDFDKIFKAKFTTMYGNPLESECKMKIHNWVSRNKYGPRKVSMVNPHWHRGYYTRRPLINHHYHHHLSAYVHV